MADHASLVAIYASLVVACARTWQPYAPSAFTPYLNLLQNLLCSSVAILGLGYAYDMLGLELGLPIGLGDCRNGGDGLVVCKCWGPLLVGV